MTRSNRLFLGSLLLALVIAVSFARYMRYREEHTLNVCVSPPFPTENCSAIVAAPGDRILLDEIAKIPDNGPVVKNYWTTMNGRSVPTEVLTDGHGGVDLYATVPEPEIHSFGRSALTPAQQLFQRCINAGGTLYGLDEDGDGFMAELGNSAGDVNAYPCVVSGYLSPPYVMPGSASDIGGDRDDTDANIH